MYQIAHATPNYRTCCKYDLMHAWSLHTNNFSTHILRKKIHLYCHRGISFWEYTWELQSYCINRKKKSTSLQPWYSKDKKKKNKHTLFTTETGNQWTMEQEMLVLETKKMNSNWNAERQWNKRTIFQLCLLLQRLQPDPHLIVLNFKCFAFPLQRDITVITITTVTRRSNLRPRYKCWPHSENKPATTLLLKIMYWSPSAAHELYAQAHPCTSPCAPSTLQQRSD